METTNKTLDFGYHPNCNCALEKTGGIQLRFSGLILLFLFAICFS